MPKDVSRNPDVGSEGYDSFKSDLGPWIESPSSSRVSRYRFDYHNRALQVQWTNNKNHGYIYRDMDYEDFRGFVRAVSKGERVNSHLNNFEYSLMSVDEVDAASNTIRYSVPTSRMVE